MNKNKGLKVYISKLKYDIKEYNYHKHNFGIKYAISFFLTYIFKKQRYKTRLRAISILDKEFGWIFEKYSKLTYSKVVENNKNIFFYWSQGKENMPFVPKKSLEQLYKLYPNYNIYFLCDNNIDEYLHLDDNIWMLYKEGKITVQTFSDILRFNLLSKYGGIWVDSTLLFLEKLPLSEYINKYGFYSLNNNSEEKNKIWGKVYPVTYTTFFLCTHKENYNMLACVEFYNEFYKKYNHAIDYFMNDYMLILCMKYKLCNNQLAQIPIIDGNPFDLYNYIENKNKSLEKIFNCPQKLNWRDFNIEKLKDILNNIGKI